MGEQRPGDMRHARIESKHRRRVWPALLAIFAPLLIIYGGAVAFFDSHFGFNTVIDGTDYSCKRISYAEKNKDLEVARYQLEITGREGFAAVISGDDVALDYRPDGQLDRIAAGQNPFLWFLRLSPNQQPYVTTNSLNYDPELFKAAVDALQLDNPETARPPADACAVYQEHQYVVQPEDLGTTVVAGLVDKEIGKAIMSLAPTLDLDDAGCYLSPVVFSTDEELLSRVATYNAWLPFCITYQFGDVSEELNAGVAMDWLVFNDDGTAWLDQSALEAWVADFAPRHDTVGKPRQFVTAYGETRTIEGGYYGWEIDQDAEIEAINNAIIGCYGETREPYYIQRAAGYGTNEWGDTYLEVDIANQYMYYTVAGEVVFECDVVTGAPWGGNETDQGAFEILEMLSPTVLKGQMLANGEREYESPVSYWMRITWPGIGFHDATWQPTFGGDWYLTNGSHGCINMPYDKAQELYSMVEVGLPVIVYE